MITTISIIPHVLVKSLVSTITTTAIGIPTATATTTTAVPSWRLVL